jgi:hypothetical protein
LDATTLNEKRLALRSLLTNSSYLRRGILLHLPPERRKARGKAYEDQLPQSVHVARSTLQQPAKREAAHVLPLT